MTYRMEYLDASNNWVPYDTKYGQVMYDRIQFGTGTASLICGYRGGGNAGEGQWASVTDPRSSRFGLLWNGTNNWQGNYTPVNSAGLPLPIPGPELYLATYGGQNDYATGYLDTASATVYTMREDAQAGYYFMKCWPSMAKASNGWMAWIGCNGSATQGLCPGLLSQNNTDIYYVPSAYYGAPQGAMSQTPNYFADPDGMVRRAMGAFVPLGTTSSPTFESGGDTRKPPSADTLVGLPMARVFAWNGANTYVPPYGDPVTAAYTSTSQVTSQAQSRPYFLHRPFRSVAELGYVFSDTPWRNLDFATAESGSAALLDTFCIEDTDNPTGLVAGRVNLNTRQAPVLKAILAGGYLDPVQLPSTTSATAHLDAVTAGLLANALVARTSDTGTSGAGPLQNISELVGRYVSKKAINDLGGLITGANQGVLNSGSGFYDGKLSYAGFGGGNWDTTNHKPATSTPAEDVYSAYLNSSAFSTNAKHNGTRETATNIQRFREAPIRTLAAAGQTRVWNLMIDVVAQTGRYPANAANANSTNPLAAFIVEREQRFWVHVAIDRLTGQVIDKQVEVVKE
ncbi:MAG: hypothetical protein QM796_08660 [Chthoniobacteraceae bacterium]